MFIRSFCAIRLPPAIRDRLTACMMTLRDTPVRAAWCRNDQLHVTLTFHGDQPESRIQDLTDLLPQALDGFSPFEIAVQGVGFFGRPHAPRVIWAGVANGSDRLVALQQAVATAAVAAGIDIEARPYHPHITLGRIRRADPQARHDLIHAVQAVETADFGILRIDQVDVMRSELTADGACHHLVKRVPVGEAG